MEMVGKCNGKVAVLLVYRFLVANRDRPSSARFIVETAAACEIWYRGELASALSNSSLAPADVGGDGRGVEAVDAVEVALVTAVVVVVEVTVAPFALALAAAPRAPDVVDVEGEDDDDPLAPAVRLAAVLDVAVAFPLEDAVAVLVVVDDDVGVDVMTVTGAEGVVGDVVAEVAADIGVDTGVDGNTTFEVVSNPEDTSLSDVPLADVDAASAAAAAAPRALILALDNLDTPVCDNPDSFLTLVAVLLAPFGAGTCCSPICATGTSLGPWDDGEFDKDEELVDAAREAAAA